jgi:hypothetical protein
MESNSPLKGGESDPLNIMCSGTDYGKYITFDETSDKDIFGFFEELSRCLNLIRELGNLLESLALVDKEINEIIQNSLSDNTMFGNRYSQKSKKKTHYVTAQINELAKCDFTFFKEFLCKVKIFHSQSNKESFKNLIEKELQDACKTSPSDTNFIYTKFEEGFSKWWRRDGNFEWLNQNSELWQTVKK